MWEDGEMMVTVVGGPNQRRDYHDDPTEEFFYQLKGDIFLRLMETPGQASARSSHQRRRDFSAAQSTCAILRKDRREASAWSSRCRAQRALWMLLNGTAKAVTNFVHRAEVKLKSIVRDLPPLVRTVLRQRESAKV